MANISDIISSMPASVRAKAEAFAQSKGISLEQAVAQQLNNELSDADLQMVRGGVAERDIDVEVEIEF